MEIALLCDEAIKVNTGAIVPIHNKTLKHNITFKHIINRNLNGIYFLLCLFLGLCPWLRGTTQGLESWMAQAPYISTIKKKRNVFIH